jgi:hypothetical protein
LQGELIGTTDTMNITIIKKYVQVCQWLMPIILATQEAEIRRIKDLGHPRQTVCETLS